MIISAPQAGPMIAGFPLPDVNTPDGGTRCVATGLTSERTRDTAGKMQRWTKIKRRAAQGAGNTRTALTRPIPLGLQSHKRREGQAVQKPRRSSYVTDGGQAVTGLPEAVINSTVSVVAR